MLDDLQNVYCAKKNVLNAKVNLECERFMDMKRSKPIAGHQVHAEIHMANLSTK
jgi:hypothetical protein